MKKYQNTEQAKKLMSAIGELDDRYILEAAAVPAVRRHLGVKLLVAAACLALVVYGGTKIWQHYNSQQPGTLVTQNQNPTQEQQNRQPEQKPQQPEQNNSKPEQNKPKPELPMLTAKIAAEGMSFEGYRVKAATDLLDGNPWQADWALTTLPVWRGESIEQWKSPYSQSKQEQMKAALRETANRLGLDELTTEQALTAWDGQGGPAIETDHYRLTVDAGLRVSIFFHHPIVMPSELTKATEESAGLQTIGDYLIKEYAALLAMKQPKTAIIGGDLDANGNRHYRLEVYEADGTAEQQLYRYRLASVSFGVAEGELSVIHINHMPKEDALIGQYPVISAEKAKEQLLIGHFQTVGFMPEDPRVDMIEQTELVYRSVQGEAYIMPYYRFLIRQETMTEADGTKTLAAYYVPAVSGEYLK